MLQLLLLLDERRWCLQLRTLRTRLTLPPAVLSPGRPLLLEEMQVPSALEAAAVT